MSPPHLPQDIRLSVQLLYLAVGWIWSLHGAWMGTTIQIKPHINVRRG